MKKYCFLFVIILFISCKSINNDIQYADLSMVKYAKCEKFLLTPYKYNKKKFNDLAEKINNYKKITVLCNSHYKLINLYYFDKSLSQEKNIKKYKTKNIFDKGVDPFDNNNYTIKDIEYEINANINEIINIFKLMKEININLIIKYDNKIEFNREVFYNFCSLDCYGGYLYCPFESDKPSIKNNDKFEYIEKLDDSWYYFYKDL